MVVAAAEVVVGCLPAPWSSSRTPFDTPRATTATTQDPTRPRGKPAHYGIKSVCWISCTQLVLKPLPHLQSQSPKPPKPETKANTETPPNLNPKHLLALQLQHKAGICKASSEALSPRVQSPTAPPNLKYETLNSQSPLSHLSATLNSKTTKS